MKSSVLQLLAQMGRRAMEAGCKGPAGQYDWRAGGGGKDCNGAHHAAGIAHATAGAGRGWESQKAEG